jgi:hypothetical protein
LRCSVVHAVVVAVVVAAAVEAAVAAAASPRICPYRWQHCNHGDPEALPCQRDVRHCNRLAPLQINK